jgi:hypothetical protein
MKKVLILGSMILLSGCGDNTPKCNSDDTVGLVVEIAKTKDPIIRTWMQNKTISDVALADIRTQDVNKDRQISTCAATLNLTDRETNQVAFAFPITYTTQATDDHKNIYANVYGLPSSIK